MIRSSRKLRILQLLRTHKGRRVPSPELARISLQYCARVKELRDEGYEIANETETVNGDKRGFFILLSEPTRPSDKPTTPARPSVPLYPASTMLEFETGKRVR